ncbi:hypothetical protein GCM10023185_37760 [Hymenobacter saemangeumensis]|uniref:Uncharacterized protein n=1 Tax=Hymenobacter saemangeumensis TaxID=1084522 RepID=A0ABP8IQG4_9BACT
MAEINIQRKKSSPSPWILVVLAALALALGAYFFLRPDPSDEPTPPAPAALPAAPGDTLVAAPAPGAAAEESMAAADLEQAPVTPEELARQAAGNAAAPDYARRGLQMLTATLVDLADRSDFRDPAIREQRDNLTSATTSLNEATPRLRPGFVAAAGLIRAMQQKGYPALETTANELQQLAAQLSGRNSTPAEQQQNQQFLSKAAAAVRTLSEPPVL